MTQPPPMTAEDAFFWQAFLDLMHERTQLGPIPWSAFERYARYHRVDVDDLRRVILPLDEKLREWQRAEHDRLRRKH